MFISNMISIFKGTIKFTLEQARRPRGGVTSAQERGRWSMPCPAALPLGKTLYPTYRKLGGPQGRSGQVWKISTPPGFDLQTVQPVASHYTDCIIPARPQTVIG